MDKELILKTIDQDIALSQAWASHWQAMAVSGVAKNRILFHGMEGPEFTDDEKTEEALQTSATHLLRMFELINIKKSIWADDKKEITRCLKWTDNDPYGDRPCANKVRG